jgi:cysteinyl-tRNA synthetase
MSKSLDNFFLVKDILASYSGEVIRFFLLSSHYRSPLDFSDGRLNEAKKGWERLYNAHLALQKLMKNTNLEYELPSEDLLERIQKIDTEFEEAMADDFNTSLAYASLYGMAKEINQFSSSNKINLKEVEEISTVWSKMISILGLFETTEERNEESKTDENALLDLLISLREEARKEKNWKLADRIRDGLEDCGIALEDTAEGVRWKRSEI